MTVSNAEVDRRMERFKRVCRDSGMKVTHQRVEVFRELAGTVEHPDAETIYQAVSRRVPAISRDTVYRTLSMLEDAGLVRKAQALAGPARYDANTDRHHHFVCVECGLIGDFYSDALDRFPVPREVAEVGSVEGAYVELRGRCKKCQANSKKRKTR